MVADLENDINNVRKSRIRKTVAFFNDTQRFMHEAIYHIHKLQRRADKLKLKLCVRMNGSGDIPFERIKITAHDNLNIFELFPHVQFVDYTKHLDRVLSPNKPVNLHLTLSRSEINWKDCETALASGHNVAVVFSERLPEYQHGKTYRGYEVIDGDKHDLRHLDKRAGYNLSHDKWLPGKIVGLLPKGLKAKRDTSGFVVRDHLHQIIDYADYNSDWADEKREHQLDALQALSAGLAA